jgi:hypothetical protein
MQLEKAIINLLHIIIAPIIVVGVLSVGVLKD